MSSSKIKVDPRTFKIINQAQAQSQSQSQSQTTTETFTSDSESSTSVNSDTESVKVIKLDSSEQSGGLLKQNGPSVVSTSDVRIQPSQATTTKPSIAPNPQQVTTTKPDVYPNPQQVPTTKPVVVQNDNIFNYLNINRNSEQQSSKSGLEETLSEKTGVSSTNDELENDQIGQETLEETSEKQVEDTTQDVFDLTQNKLYQVLSKFFEDVNGDGIGVNLDKMSKLFEAHNQIMEKMLNQLIIMNTNYKQVKLPDSVKPSTKQAGNIMEFRKTIEKLDRSDRSDQIDQKKP
jgi:hypothetical protein